jgi:membrane protein involved in colicin uptake
MSNLLNTKEKRKSAIITTFIMIAILFAMFYVGLSYLDPPEEFGIALNFGTSNVGKGNLPPKQIAKPVVEKSVSEEEVKSEQKATEQKVVATEKVITQNTEDAIAIKKQQEAKKKAEAIAKQKAEEEAKKKVVDNIVNGIKNSDGTTTGGQGNDNVNGDKGKINGDPYTPSYFGNGGTGKGVGYGLNHRGKPSSTIFEQDCNEYGVVVVRIEVDRSGKVIKATPGVKGSTNTAACLIDPAKKIALSFKWPADKNAPLRQIGFVSINFNEHNKINELQ